MERVRQSVAHLELWLENQQFKKVCHTSVNTLAVTKLTSPIYRPCTTNFVITLQPADSK